MKFEGKCWNVHTTCNHNCRHDYSYHDIDRAEQFTGLNSKKTFLAQLNETEGAVTLKHATVS
jgi:hypothetical protein